MKNCPSNFSNLNIVVIGDLMLDKYIFGDVERISPEAPVQIVSVIKEKYVPGGAANAANNVASLGGNVHLFGIIGFDSAKDILFKELKKKNINIDGVIVDSGQSTIQKIRVIGQNQQLLRIDYEGKQSLDENKSNKIIEKILKIKEVNAIVISDYAKGVITRAIMSEIKDYALKNDIFVIVDPKPKNKILYNGVSLITPNIKEAQEMTGITIGSARELEKAGKQLMNELDCNVLITTGAKGMSLFEISKKPVHISAAAKEVYDVSGAGDTVVSTLSLALSSGASLEDSTRLANHAAGIKVSKLGTAPVLLGELQESMK